MPMLIMVMLIGVMVIIMWTTMLMELFMELFTMKSIPLAPCVRTPIATNLTPFIIREPR